MDRKQPKPDSKKYSDLISEIENGIIRIPKFQRDFVWSIDKTAGLLDSILKGYPIGTFILWETDERMNDIKCIGDLQLPDISDKNTVEYVLDGQQRIVSLFAAYRGAKIKKSNEKRETDYCNIFVNLDEDVSENDDQIVTSDEPVGKYISLHQVLNFNYEVGKKLESDNYSTEQIDTISRYFNAFETYVFSTIVLRQKDINSAIEVFTRINTGGQELTLFEIMSAKTYDENQKFDMQDKWNELIKRLGDCGYEGISSSVILYLLSFVLSKSKECKTKTILALDKQTIIDNWDSVVSALEDSIEYFRTTYRIPVSKILPYDSILVPFAYFFYKNKDQPDAIQRKFLEEYFWCASLSERYSKSPQSRLAQDIKRIDKILDNVCPEYKEIKSEIQLAPQYLIDTSFSTGSSYCKAILCLLASEGPRDFKDNSMVILDNSYLKKANSKNYHHFFPKAFLKKKNIPNENSLMNITFVSDHLNKREIGAKSPSDYISKFGKESDNIEKSLNSHFIKLDGFGIDNDDYDTFLNARAKWIYEKLQSKLPNREKPID